MNPGSKILRSCFLHCKFSSARSRNLAGGSPSTSLTVYTKHVQWRLDGGIAVNVLWLYTRSMCIWGLIRTNGECSSNRLTNTRSLDGKLLPKKNCRFSKNPVLNLQTRILPKTRFSVTNSFVYRAVTRQSAHELSHDQVVEEWCIAFDGILSLSLSLSPNRSPPCGDRLRISSNLFQIYFSLCPPSPSQMICLYLSLFLSFHDLFISSSLLFFCLS